MTPRGALRARPCRRPIVAVLAFVLLAALAPGTGAHAPARSGAHALGAEPSGARPRDLALPVIVTPAAVTILAGGSIQVSAAIPPPPGECVPIGALFSWQLAGSSDLLGSVNATLGNATGFHSFPYANGTAVVVATANGLANCGGLPELFHGLAFAHIEIRPPLAVGSLAVSPDPVVAGRSTVLNVSFQGGLPPYTVAFTFGDGASESLSAAGPGVVSAAHRYAAGGYRPTALVSDSLGEAVAAGSGPSVEVAQPLAVAITASTLTPDLGVAVNLTASVVGGLPPYQLFWNATDGRTHLGPGWDLAPHATGSLRVSVTATDALGESASVDTSLVVPPALNVSLSALRAVDDLHTPLPVELALAGGAPPYTVNVTAEPSGSHFTLTGVGPADLPNVLVPGSVGELWADLIVTDSGGASLTAVLPLAAVEAAPTLSLSATADTLEAGSPLSLIALESGGEAPYNWTLASTARPLPGDPTTLLGSGSPLYAWTGTLAATGPAIFLLSAQDAAGAIAVRNVSVSVLPALRAEAFLGSPSATAGDPVAVELTVSGGVPPYALSVGLSDGLARSANLTAPGSIALTLEPPAPGALAGSATVVDAMGAMRNLSFEVNVSAVPANANATHPPPAGSGPGTVPPSPPGGAAGGAPSVLPGLAGALVGVVLLAGLGWLLLRGRAKLKAARNARPLSRVSLDTVRRLLQENEAIDRDSLLLLAEDERLGEGEVDAALTRWESLGRVRKETDPTGTTCYHWSGSGPAPAPSGDPDGASAAEEGP
jgi:hypothetical protein